MRTEEAEHRKTMVDYQLRARGIADPVVLTAMETVPRHKFVPSDLFHMAYADGPLPIGCGQTISQPYVVAAMSEALELQSGDRVLEVGTGSGYQTAVLCEMGLEVYTMEFVPKLAEKARETLVDLGYKDIHFRVGDGHAGWPEEAPFDGIIVTAAPVKVPEQLCRQLRPGCRLVIPVGHFSQDLRVYEKDEAGNLTWRSLFPVRFVPLVKA